MYDILKGLLPWKNKMLAWFLFELFQKGNLLKIEKQILIDKKQKKIKPFEKRRKHFKYVQVQ